MKMTLTPGSITFDFESSAERQMFAKYLQEPDKVHVTCGPLGNAVQLIVMRQRRGTPETVNRQDVARNAKLTETEVRAMLEDWLYDGLSVKQLMDKYQAGEATVINILQGKTRRSVERPPGFPTRFELAELGITLWSWREKHPQRRPTQAVS